MPTTNNSVARLNLLRSAESAEMDLTDVTSSSDVSHSEKNATSALKNRFDTCSTEGCVSHTHLHGTATMCDVCNYVSNRSSGNTVVVAGIR